MKNFLTKITIINSLAILVSCENYQFNQLSESAEKISAATSQRLNCINCPNNEYRFLTQLGQDTLSWSSDRRFILARNLLNGTYNINDYCTGMCHEVSAYIKFLYDGVYLPLS
ncbi:hypothetical protein [Chryseobacterium nematophagum]|uniref:hypothetical protein n=1 Tax=Chryseobacterium nematophagum TaxID=2305228 RepID=UPI0011C36C03|nr:hypothetical protein [Chryseobacterium nematophagum]